MAVYTVGLDEIFEEVNDFGNLTEDDYWASRDTSINFDEDDYWETDAIYADWSDKEYDEVSWFFSPDGIGRIWFDTLEEAKSETGLTKVNSLY